MHEVRPARAERCLVSATPDPTPDPGSPQGLIAVEDAPARRSSDISELELDRRRNKHHRFWLVTAIFVVVASFVLVNDGPEDVALPLGNGRLWTLPRTCGARALTGYDCPGCGMTRSFVSIAHGRFADAWRYHRMGAPFFALVLFQIVYRPIMLVRRAWGPGGALGRLHVWVPTVLIVGLLLNWVTNIIIGRPS